MTWHGMRAHTVAVHVEGADGVRPHDGLRQRVVGAQEPGVVLLQQPPDTAAVPLSGCAVGWPRHVALETPWWQ
jgi:hypothetical protein